MILILWIMMIVGIQQIIIETASALPPKSTGTLIFEAARKYTNQTYVWGKNDCDFWVERILEESGVRIRRVWKSAAMHTVWQHYQALKTKTVRTPERGWNIFLQLWEKDKGLNHTGLCYLNEDKTILAFHQGPNVLPNERKEYAYSVELKFESISKFEEGLSQIWSGISEFHYYPLRIR